MMVKQYKDLWLPDRENYLIQDIDVSEPYKGMATIQFKKLKRALPCIKRFGHAVDIGANLGIWTRTLSHMFEHVTCFEPSPECYEAFHLNNPRKNVTLHECALSSSDGTIILNNTFKSTGWTQVSDIGITVPCKTLDSFELQYVDFIKIDVEGWEWHVVRGAEKTIRKWKPVMILEQKPNNAERYGVKQFKATSLLEKWGAKIEDNISGDVIMVW